MWISSSQILIVYLILSLNISCYFMSCIFYALFYISTNHLNVLLEFDNVWTTRIIKIVYSINYLTICYEGKHITNMFEFFSDYFRQVWVGHNGF